MKPKVLNREQREFESLMKAAGWSAAETARQLKFTRSAISQILSGKNTPDPRTLQLLRITVSQVGQETSGDSGAGLKPKRSKSNVRPSPEGQQVPVISWSRAGTMEGRGLDYEDLEHQIDEHVWARTKDKNAFALIIDGDSMSPDYQHGDRVVFSPNEEARPGDAVVVRLEDGRVFFKILRMQGATLTLESINPRYEPLKLKWEQVRFCYPAVELSSRQIRR